MAAAKKAPKKPERRYKPRPSDAPTTDAKELAATRRWKRELTLAEKREKDWRKEAEKIEQRYSNEEGQKKNQYNILWSNTDILAPSVYNAKPEPDVRRRFRDSDPIGKAASEVLERSLFFMCDGDTVDEALKADVLDGLLAGRGVSWVRYVPQLAQVPGEKKPKQPSDNAETQAEGGDLGGSTPPEGAEGSYEQLEFEQAVLEHVDWRDFRHGFARQWGEVPWVARRHKLDKEDSVGKFGKEALVGLEYAPEQIDSEKKYHEEEQSVTKVAEFWELWDKVGGQVFFIQETLDHRLFPLDNLEGKPPLTFDGFFPCPQPLRLVMRPNSLSPIPLYRLYEDLALQLDTLTARMARITKGLRLRGIYDSRLDEIGDMLSSEDNEMTPVQNAQQWADAGGLDKAIHWMPVEKAVEVLVALDERRTRIKAQIDELTGISDIVRGVTDPDETLGAQQMKGGYFSVRLWRMQAEVKRYGRDLLRLAGQIMAQRFGVDTFRAMTDLKFPTNEERAALLSKLQLVFQQSQIQAPSPIQPPQPGAAPPGAPAAPPGPAAMPTPSPGVPPGAPPPAPAGPPHPPGPPPPGGAGPQGPNPLATLQAALRVPTWEQIVEFLHSPALRQFRTDIETDSMIAGTIQADMAGLAQVLTAIAETMQGLAPLVESGALPVDAAKELVLTVIRRARMGTAVEDQFEKMQAPQPKPPPPDPRLQVAQAAAAGKVQETQITETAETQRLQFKEQQENLRKMMGEHAEQQRELLDRRFDAFVKIIVATISATKQADPAAGALSEQGFAAAAGGAGNGT